MRNELLQLASINGRWRTYGAIKLNKTNVQQVGGLLAETVDLLRQMSDLATTSVQNLGGLDEIEKTYKLLNILFHRFRDVVTKPVFRKAEKNDQNVTVFVENVYSRISVLNTMCLGGLRNTLLPADPIAYVLEEDQVRPTYRIQLTLTKRAPVSEVQQLTFPETPDVPRAD